MSLKAERVSSDIAEDFDEKACEFCDKYKKSGLSGSSKILLGFLTDTGLGKRTLLDLGCGSGSFIVESLKNAASSALGLDLSGEMVKTASELASATGFGDVAKFQVGNAAEAELPPSDVVVLDKVICCYPDFARLLTNAGRASKGTLGFVVPRNEGLFGALLKPGVWIMNLFEKRRKGSLFYLHSLSAIDRVLKGSGFEQTRKEHSRMWLIYLYRRHT